MSSAKKFCPRNALLVILFCESDLRQHELHLVCGDAAGLVLAEHAERLLEALLLVLVRLELLCQRRRELRPLNLAAVVGVHRVDDVLHLLLAGVDPPAVTQYTSGQISDIRPNSRSAEGEHELLGGDVPILVVVEVAEGRLVLVHVLGLERQLGLGLLLGEGAAAEDAGRAAQQTGDTAPWSSCRATSRYVDMCRYIDINITPGTGTLVAGFTFFISHLESSGSPELGLEEVEVTSAIFSVFSLVITLLFCSKFPPVRNYHY